MLWKPHMLVLKYVVMMILCQGLTRVVGAHAGDVYWNSSNSIFLLDNTNHVFSVRIDDHMNLYCPKYENTTDRAHTEVSRVYRVNQFGYDFCSINKSTSESAFLGFCNKPYTEQLITIKFRSFTPNPSGPEFQPYKTYFFISTSNGSENGMENTDGGLCAQKNMRLRLEVYPRVPVNPPSTPSPWGYRPPRPIEDSYEHSDAHQPDTERRRSDSINNYEIVGDGHNGVKEEISWGQEANDHNRYDSGGKRSDQSSTKQTQFSDQPPVVINLSPAERRNVATKSLSVGAVLTVCLCLLAVSNSHIR